MQNMPRVIRTYGRIVIRYLLSRQGHMPLAGVPAAVAAETPTAGTG